jgi:hypothetical protein
MAALSGNFTLSSNANDTFLSSVADDVMVFPDSNSQRVHIGVNKGMAPAMCVTSNGVGINNTSPAYPLDVAGSCRMTGQLYLSNSLVPQGGTAQFLSDSNALVLKCMTQTNATTSGATLAFDTFGANFGTNVSCKITGQDNGNNGGTLGFWTGGGQHLALLSSGYLGVGTLNPQAPLHVGGTSTAPGAQNYFSLSTYLANSGGTGLAQLNSGYNKLVTGGLSGSSSGWCAFFNGSVYVGNELDFGSDRRIKTDVRDVSADAASALVDTLRPVTYRMVDPLQRQHTRHGFIAQEVEAVFPSMVRTTTEFLPDVMKMSTSTCAENADGVLTVAGHGLAAGERVRMHRQKQTGGAVSVEDATVSSVLDEDRFKVANADAAADGSDAVFVYGREVRDFKLVNYESIFTVAVKAIQEQKAQIDALRAEVESLRVLVRA